MRNKNKTKKTPSPFFSGSAVLQTPLGLVNRCAIIVFATHNHLLPPHPFPILHHRVSSKGHSLSQITPAWVFSTGCSFSGTNFSSVCFYTAPARRSVPVCALHCLHLPWRHIQLLWCGYILNITNLIEDHLKFTQNPRISYKFAVSWA